MRRANSGAMLRLLIFLVTLGVRALRAIFRSREELVIENVALMQQVRVMKTKRPRPVLDDADRAFWVALSAAWPGWASRLVIVTPDTVAKWHRDRFRRYRVKICKQGNGPGRPRIDPEVRCLIRTMARDGWGAPQPSCAIVRMRRRTSTSTRGRPGPCCCRESFAQ